MGIFSNRCEALVNPVTGQALTGAALKAAQKEPSWPRCGKSVSKSAHFCSCGAPAPGGWVKCPKCGEWVGNDSHFCWNCNTPLHPDTRAAIANGIWLRESGLFAQRFESYEMQTKDGTELQVQEGTSAILISGGEVEDVLDAGRFKVESMARKINWFGNPPNRSAVLLETGEIVLPVEVKDLPTKAPDGNEIVAGMPIDFYGEAVVRFSGGKDAAVTFIENAMKGRRELTFSELTERIKSLLMGEVRDFCRRTTLDELLTDADGRENLRKAISRHLEDEFNSIGLDLVRMSSAEFKNAAYRELEQKSGELDKKRRQEEYRMAAEELARKLELKQFRDDHAFRLAKEALDHEHQISEADRDKAWQQLLQDREDSALRDQRNHELKQLELQREYDLKKKKIEDEWAEQMQDVRDDEDEKRRKRALKQERLIAEEEEYRRRRELELKRFKEEEEDRLWKREMIKNARIEEEEAKKRKRDAEEKVRAEKESESARIREWARLEEEQTHRWTQEDAALQRSWKTEIERLQHDGEVAAMVQRAAKAKLEDEINEKRVRYFLDLELKAKQGDFLREEQQKNAVASANVRKIEAGANLDIRKDTHEQDVVEAASGIGLRERKVRERQREEKELIDRINDAVARNDELTAQMLRKQYEKLFIEESW